MKIIFLFFVAQLFILNQANAEKLSITDGHKKIHINLNKKKLEYQDENFKKIILRKKCNKAVFDKFRSRIKNESKSLVKIKGDHKFKDSLKVKVGKTDKIALRFSEPGKFFSRLPSSVRNLWFTSERVCKK